MAKNLVLGPIFPIWCKFGLPDFVFSKILFCQSLDFMATYIHVQYQGKKDPILRKLSDGCKDKQMKGRTDIRQARVIS